jgi:hypothetical protein
MHVTVKLTIFVGLSVHKEYLLSLLFFPILDKQGHLLVVYILISSENTLFD